MDQKTLDIEVLVPFKQEIDWKPKTIKLVHRGEMKNNALNKHIWLNFMLPIYACREKRIIVNMCNLAPLLKPDIVCIHDILYKTHKQFFPIRKRIVPYIYYWFNIKLAKLIVTVSEYSKQQIMIVYGRRDDEIKVVPNGWEHIIAIHEDNRAFSKFDIEPDKYYMALGNISPHKNLKWVVNEARKNTESKFIIVGQKVLGLSRDTYFDYNLPNLFFTCRISDEEMKALLMHCRALLFPSYEEGFGIPPLEALALGRKIILSDRTCLPDIFKETAIYIDPDRYDYDLEDLIHHPDAGRDRVLEENTWRRSAAKWKHILEQFGDSK